MRFASLGSGSEGNSLVVEVAEGATLTRVMLDCGFGIRDAEKRLARLGLQAGELDAIFVTHEHGDHIGGVMKLAKKHRIPVWLTYGTYSAAFAAAPFAVLNADDSVQFHLIDNHTPLVIGNLEVTPYPVPHDAREPTQFVFGDGDVRLGVLTDVGSTTAYIESVLSGCDALVLEANHDEDMLGGGPYPASLKRRVGGRFGHLSNAQSAELLTRLDCSKLKHLLAAHLSRQNNTRALAQFAFAGALDCAPEWVGIADQDEGFDWREI